VAQSIQGYLNGLPSEHKRIVTALLRLVQQAAPTSTAAMKWEQVVFELGGPVCYIRSTPSHVAFGFWRGVELTTAKGRLQPDTKKMAHLELKAEGDIRPVLFQSWVKEAVRLNRALGSPTA
jgi:hypothetical protein